MMTGGCLCGAVRYEARGAPLWSGFCHCRDCQRITGTGHSCYRGFPREAVTVQGETRGYGVTADSGHVSVRRFCPTCGSHIFGEAGNAPGTISIYAGTLDDPSLFKPANAVFVRSRPEWDRMPGGLPEFAALPGADEG